MKKDYSSKIISLILIVFLLSCKERKIEQFKISIILTQDLGCNVGDPLPKAIKSLIDYYIDTSCSDKLYVPSLTIIRTDLNPEISESISVPLSKLNDWRKSIDLLPASNLMEDYDENIPKLVSPKILCEKSNQILDINTIRQKYNTSIQINNGDSLLTQIVKVKSQIAKSICKNGDSDFIILLVQETKDTTYQIDLNQVFRKLTDLNFSPDIRMNLIPDFLTQVFANNSTIEEFGENKTRVGIQSTQDYLNQIVLSRTISSIEIIGAQKNSDGKYWTVKIIERHKLTQ